MRIVIVGAGMLPIPPIDYGAVEKHIWNLSAALEARGHDVRIVNEVVGPTSKDEYRWAFRARKLVKAHPHDVVHLHTPGVATIFSATGPSKFVYTTHSRHWSGAQGMGEKVGHFLERRAVANATEVIAVSRFVAEQIDRPSHVIPNGVDVSRYVPLPSARHGKRVVGVGEIAPHKQWLVAAEALKGLDARLHLAGPIRDVSYARALEASGAELLGAMGEADLTRHLGEGDILAHPSISESFGMAVVEGMSAGLPVIASDLLSFLVKHGGTGYLIPTSAPHDERVRIMREQLIALLADPALRTELGDAGRAAAVAGYSWESVAERVEAVYERAVGA